MLVRILCWQTRQRVKRFSDIKLDLAIIKRKIAMYKFHHVHIDDLHDR